MILYLITNDSKNKNTDNLKLPLLDSTDLNIINKRLINFTNIAIKTDSQQPTKLSTCFMESIKINPDISRLIYLKKIREYEKKFGKNSAEVYLKRNSIKTITDLEIVDWILTYEKYLKSRKNDE
jgi:hypothetical protein